MQAGPMKLLNLLGENKTTFSIPVYQRNYEWKAEHIEKLFDDIVNIIDNEYRRIHFLGTIVFVSSEKSGLVMERTIIDGQQRVTSTILLLKAIYDLLDPENSGENNLRNEIYDSYIVNRYIDDDYKYKLRPVEQDKRAYIELLEQGANNPTSRIYENYHHFKKLIVDSQRPPLDIYHALANMEVVYISLTDGSQSENAQLIFESLNSTGLSLTQADLIRNFVLMSLGYDEQTYLYRKYWARLEKLLSNARISDFVRDFLTMKTGRIPNKSKVYDDFKLYFISHRLTSESILKQLLEYAQYYYQFINISAESPAVNDLLWSFDQMRSTVVYPYLLSLFHAYHQHQVEEDEFLDVLQRINTYLYRRSICNMPTNALNKVFATMDKGVKQIQEEQGGTLSEAVTDYLMSRTGSASFPRNIQFENAFKEFDIYTRGNKLALYTLFNIEQCQHKEVVSFDQLTVEHIMPQTLTPKWRLDLGRDSDEVHKLYKNTVGNLTLTNYNSEMSNKSFEDKKTYYQSSNIQLTRAIAAEKQWNRESILERAEGLFAVAKEIWEQPEDNYSSRDPDVLEPGVDYPLSEPLHVTGRRPESVTLENNVFPVSSWKEMLLTTCGYLLDKDRDFFYSLVQNRNFENLLFSEEKGRRPEPISVDLFVETNMTADAVINFMRLCTAEYKIDDAVSISIRF